jgi:hypothetical protein
MNGHAAPGLRIYPNNCEACRLRKVKCNRIKPCAQCELRGIADECYAAAPRISPGGTRKRSSMQTPSSPRPADSPSNNIHKARRLDQVESVRSPGRPTSVNVSLASKNGTSATRYSGDNQADKGKQRQIDALSLLASATANSPVQWEDVSPFLTSASHCVQLFDFFFDEVSRDTRRRCTLRHIST